MCNTGYEMLNEPYMKYILLIMKNIFNLKRKTYPLRFFHLAKNDSPFMSVGSKNLFIDKGNCKESLCGTLPYVKLTIKSGKPEKKKKKFHYH